MFKQYLNCLILSSCVFNGVAFAETSAEANDSSPEKKFRLALSADAYFFTADELGFRPEIRPEFRTKQLIVRGAIGPFIYPSGNDYMSYGFGVGYSFEQSEKLRIEPALDLRFMTLDVDIVYLLTVYKAALTARYLFNESLDTELSVGASKISNEIVPNIGLGLGYNF